MAEMKGEFKTVWSRAFPLLLVFVALVCSVVLLATEHTDDFGTDPSARWTRVIGATPVYTWDNTNFEMDMATNSSPYANRYNTGPGSIEHEAQVTWLPANNPQGQDVGGPAVRVDDASTECYYLTFNPGTNTAQVRRLNAAGNSTTIGTSVSFTSGYTDWITARLSAAGTAGSEVTLNVWLQTHGGTKPSDPGWIGVDGSPDHTVTDNAATGTRHDATDHEFVGIGGNGQGSDFDTRHDFWKGRNISDRAGGGGGTGTGPRRTLMGIGALLFYLPLPVRS